MNSGYDNKRDEDDYSSLLLNNDVSNVINILNNNFNNSLKERNRITNDKINSIQNNYYQIKYLLDNKINKLEKNQKKVFDFMKYSLDKEQIKNDMDKKIYKNYINNIKQKNNTEKGNLMNMLKEVHL